MKNNKLLIILSLALVSLMFIQSCNDRDSPTAKLPNNVVAIGFKPGVGDVLMNIQPKNGSIITYELLEDLGVSGYYNIQVNESRGNVEFIMFGNSNPQVVKIISYNAKADNITEEVLSVDTDTYYWSSGASTNEYVVARGMAYGDTEKAYISITNRESNSSEVIEICADCYWTTDYSPFLVQDNRLFTLYPTSSTWAMTAVELATGELLFNVDLPKFPNLIIGESNLFMNPSYQVMDIYDLESFEKTGTYNFPYETYWGIHGSVDNKAVVFRSVAQPTQIPRIPYICDIRTGNILQEFTFNGLSSNTLKFGEQMGVNLNSTPALVHIGLTRDFTIFQTQRSDGSTSAWDLVYSNYDSDYLSHTSLPYEPEEILMVHWN